MGVEERVLGIWNEARPEGRTVVLRAILGLLSLPYGAMVAARNRLYDGGLLKQEKFDEAREASEALHKKFIANKGDTPMESLDKE